MVIEKSQDRAGALAAEYEGCDHVDVMHGDADEPSVLLEAGVDRADVFVAATGHDEDNLVACLLAKNEYKVKKVIAAVRNPRNRWLYNRSWGVDVALDSAQIVTRLIEEEATLDRPGEAARSQGRRCHRHLDHGDRRRYPGRQAVRPAAAPPGRYPAAVLRGSQVVMPAPDVCIEVGDMLLVIAGPGGECRLDEWSKTGLPAAARSGHRRQSARGMAATGAAGSPGGPAPAR